MEQKTIKEWFETLPEPIRSQALENGLNECLNTMHIRASKLSHAIDMGFIWEDTPEGLKYWCNISERASSGEFNTK